MSTVSAVRRLVSQPSGHPVISLYLDLDPEQFATAPARASQIQSLIDEAGRRVEADEGLTHDELVALREDVERLRRYLLSREAPFQGARGLAIFCSGRDDLFEVVQVGRPVEGQVIIARTPYVEPLMLGGGGAPRRWCVVLVNRRDGRIFTGVPEALEEQAEVQDDVHGQHDQGGWSQARYQRSVDQEADVHLRAVADRVMRLWQRRRFDQLALGGPQEVVARFCELLAEELRSRLIPARLEVDMSAATLDDVRAALASVAEQAERERERAALDRLAEALGSGGRGAGGIEDVVRALNERRVETLLLEPGVDRAGARCPTCGLLTADGASECPADGTPLEEVEHLREALVEAALRQDAEVILVQSFPDLGPHRGIGALLRF